MNLMHELVQLEAKLDTVLFEENEEPYKRRIIQRAILGPHGTAFIHGKKGERFAGAGEAYGYAAGQGLIGSVAGLGAGLAAAGGTLGALKLLKKPLTAKDVETAFAGGGYGGLAVGGAVGGYRGTYGKKAEEIYRRRTGQDRR